MANRSHIGSFLLTAGSFIGGIALGLLLAPKSGKENRKWVSDNAAGLADWIDEKGNDVYHKGGKRFNHFRGSVKKEFNDTIPDLYKATEQIDMDLDDAGLKDG